MDIREVDVKYGNDDYVVGYACRHDGGRRVATIDFFLAFICAQQQEEKSGKVELLKLGRDETEGNESCSRKEVRNEQLPDSYCC